jgi:hypothetical protein
VNKRGSIEILVIGFVLVAMFVGGYWYWRNQNQESGKPITPTVVPTLKLTPTVTPEKTTKTVSGEGFTFELPKIWRVLRHDDLGIGLLPNEIYDAGQTTVEILTIGTKVTMEKPKDWSISFNGLGYSQEKELEVNGSATFYSVYEKGAYTDIKYVISNGSRIIATNFRKLSEKPKMDNSKYVSEMEEIVNSVQFTPVSDEMRKINFEIDTVQVNPQLKPSKLSITSEMQSDFGLSRINDTAYKIELERNNTVVYVFSGLGESGGVYSGVHEYSTVENIDESLMVARVKLGYDQLYFKNEIGTFDSKRSYFIYTTDFGDKVKCASDDSDSFCGTQEVKFGPSYIGIICEVSEIEDSKICDQFVENLNVK